MNNLPEQPFRVQITYCCTKVVPAFTIKISRMINHQLAYIKFYQPRLFQNTFQENYCYIIHEIKHFIIQIYFFNYLISDILIMSQNKEMF